MLLRLFMISTIFCNFFFFCETVAKTNKKTSTLFEKCSKLFNIKKKQLQPTEGIVKRKHLKDWSFIVYMAANNNLHRFALHNFRQMLKVGSNENINIILQIDEFGESEVSRFSIEQGQANLYETISHTPEAISGTPESLYGFLNWAITHFPARHYAVLLWNHGAGIKDPSIWGKFYDNDRNKLFQKDEKSGLMKLKRRLKQNINYENEDQLIVPVKKKRGIAFNEVHQTYITNQELNTCLEKVRRELLHDKKFDIIFMDACHMGMVEIGSELKNIANYMVGSGEIEPGTGYNYTFLLEPFLNTSLSPIQFVKHAVEAFEAEYLESFADFTQVGLSLENFDKLERSINNFSELLFRFIMQHEDNFKFIRNIRKNYKDTTEFFDEDYIDVYHFLKSIIEKLKKLNFFDNEKSITMLIEKAATECLQEFDKSIIAHKCGVNLSRSIGLGIYFPQKLVHHSYLKTFFAQRTLWPNFLTEFAKRSRLE